MPNSDSPVNNLLELPETSKSVFEVKSSLFNYSYNLISDLFCDIDNDVLIKFSFLPENKREDIKDGIILHIQTQIYRLIIIKTEEIQGRYSQDIVRKVVNIFSPSIIKTLIETNLRYRLCLVDDSEANQLPKEIKEKVQNAFNVMLQSDKEDFKSVFDQLINLTKEKQIALISSCINGATTDLTKIMLLISKLRQSDIKKGGSPNIRIFQDTASIDILISMLSPLSQILIFTRLQLEIYLEKEKKPRIEEVTRLMRAPTTTELINQIENNWESNTKQYMFLIKLNSKSEILNTEYIKKLLEIGDETLETKVSFIEISNRKLLINIIGEDDITRIQDFIKGIQNSPLTREVKPNVSFSLLDPRIFDNKFDTFTGDFRSFINEVVVTSIFKHLGEGLTTSENSSEEGMNIGCGNVTIYKKDFIPQNISYLAMTQLSYAPRNLGNVTEVKSINPQIKEEIAKQEEEQGTNPGIPSKIQVDKTKEVKVIMSVETQENQELQAETRRAKKLRKLDKDDGTKIIDRYHLQEAIIACNEPDDDEITAVDVPLDGLEEDEEVLNDFHPQT